ncbi:hypothetical protein M758_UG064700 [Ceratodon purpureus]|nr:hypothetical protein M758_UG064700 [Ceratodon purpureus]
MLALLFRITIHIMALGSWSKTYQKKRDFWRFYKKSASHKLNLLNSWPLNNLEA